MSKSKKQVRNNKLDVALGLSVLLSLLFFYSVLRVLQDVRLNDMLGSPNSFAAWPSLALAIYVFLKSEVPSRKYISVAVITLLVSGSLTWLLGATAAGSYLATYWT